MSCAWPTSTLFPGLVTWSASLSCRWLLCLDRVTADTDDRDADPEKLQRAQGGGRVSAGSTTSASALEKAERILSKIRGKLRPDLSIEYTVNQLIQEARDVENLAKIFVGWQPWF